MAESEDQIGNTIEHHPDLGYFINVFDYRPETLERMDSFELQGGGPTWLGLITAALQIETPETLNSVDFDDEADVLLITSSSEPAMQVIQSYVSLLMSDDTFMTQCVEHARTGGYLE